MMDLSVLSNPDTLWRTAIALACFVLGWSIGWFIHRRLKKAIATYPDSLVLRFLKVITPAIAPIVTMLCLFGASGIVKTMGYELILLPVLGRLCTVWLVLSLIQAITGSKLKTLILAAIVIPITLLNEFGALGEITGFLDEYSFKLGQYTFSMLNVVNFVLAIFILIWIAGAVIRVFDDVIHKTAMNTSTATLLSTITKVGIYTVTVFIGLNILGIDLTGLAVLGGALGVGIGFGLQKIASNFISGIILLLEKSLRIGDLVELGVDERGFVRKIGARYSLIETLDNREVMVPNEEFISQRVTNLTYSNSRGRLQIDIGVAYKSDLDLVYKLLLEAANEHPKISAEKKPVCFLRAFGDSSVNFVLFVWVDNIVEGRWTVQSDILFTIWNKFKEHNIEIPFPQRDVTVKNISDLASPSPVATAKG